MTANESGTSPRELRVGVIGLGMGRHHVVAFNAHPHARVVALCDLDADRLASIGDEHAIDARYDDAAKMLAEQDLDIVSVATPNRFHHPLTLQAIEAGAHVLCEKPMAMNAAEGREMVDAASAAGRKLAIHYNHRQRADVQVMGRYIEAGELGQVYFVRTTWHRRRGIPGRPTFVSRQHSGGGCLIDLGVHIIDIALYLARFPRIVSVSGQVHRKFDQKYVPHLAMDVEDFATAYVRCEGGLTIAIEVSWASHHDHAEQMLTHVYGSEAGLTRRIEHYADPQIRLHKLEHGSLVTSRIETMPTDVLSVQEDLVNAVLEDREPACSAEHGLMLMQVLDALYTSSQSGREVVLGT